MDILPPRRHTLTVATGVLVLLLTACQTSKQSEPFADGRPVWSTADGAIDGYDPVAYFTTDTATKGSPVITVDIDGATWHFDSEDHRQMFLANPMKYIPAYGGHCSMAMAVGYEANGDGQQWDVVGGVLHLNATAKARENWRQDVSGNISKGNEHWTEFATDRFPYAADWLGNKP